MQEKVDIRCKLDPRDHAFLSGEAQARGIDICIVLREVIGEWVELRRRAHSITQKLLVAQGHSGAYEGGSGQRRGAGALQWGDE